MLLSGKPPFDGKNDKEIIRNVLKGVVNMDIPELEEMIYDGKRKLLKNKFDYNLRLGHKKYHRVSEDA